MRKDVDKSGNDFAKSVFLDLEVRKNADKGATYHRIVNANKKAKKMGLSYGRYMAGLWEEKERTPIKKIEKPKKKKEPERRLLTGDEAAEYIKYLKIKAGTWEEPKASKLPENQRVKKVMLKEWNDICGKLRPYEEQLKSVQIVAKKEETE